MDAFVGEVVPDAARGGVWIPWVRVWEMAYRTTLAGECPLCGAGAP